MKLLTSAEFVKLRGFHEFDGPAVLRARRSTPDERRARVRARRKRDLATRLNPLNRSEP